MSIHRDNEGTSHLDEQSSTLEEIHILALKRFNIVQSRESDNRELAIEDTRFANSPDGQWDDDIIQKRIGRPRYTINKIAGVIRQVVGNQRQNRTDIKVIPLNRDADDNVAKVLSGLIRNIEAQSKASNAYDGGFEEAVTGGYGGWRVVTENADEFEFDKNVEDMNKSVFNKEIKIEPILSAASSLWFGPSQRFDKSDAPWAFYVVNMSDDEFKQEYPDASRSDFPQEQLNNHSCNNNWFSAGTVRVAEYWVKEPIKKELGLMSDDRILDLKEEKKVLDELAAVGITVLKTRIVDSHKVVKYIMSGTEILKGPIAWAGKFIPLVPEFGIVTHIQQQELVRGIVRFAKDPSRIYNYATSAAIEAAALAPKDPIWYTPKQVEGYKSDYENHATSNKPFLPYNPDPDAPGPPQRTGAPQVQTALLEQIRQAGDDIEATSNMFSPAMGNAPQLLSEKSVASQAAMGDRGMFEYADNHEKAIQYTGQILVDLIPQIYDTERTVKILDIDGTSRDEVINFEAVDNLSQTVIDRQTGDKVIVNDLLKGKYTVAVTSGPSFLTRRDESAQQLIQLASSSPVFERVAMDLIAKNLPILETEELTKRVRKIMISDGIVEPTEEETQELGLNQQQEPDPVQVATLDNITANTQLTLANADNKQADTLRKQIQAQQDTAKTLQVLFDTVLDKINGGVPVTEQERDMLIKQRDIVEEGQQALDPGLNSEQEEIVQTVASQALANQGVSR